MCTCCVYADVSPSCGLVGPHYVYVNIYQTYTLYRIVCLCVGGGDISESREGQECVWSSCRLLHQTGIAGAVHIPPVVLPAFLHTPALNILLWKNPLRRYRPLPLHTLKISSRDHLYTPPCSLFFLPSAIVYSYYCCTDAL